MKIPLLSPATLPYAGSVQDALVGESTGYRLNTCTNIKVRIEDYPGCLMCYRMAVCVLCIWRTLVWNSRHAKGVQQLVLFYNKRIH